LRNDDTAFRVRTSYVREVEAGETIFGAENRNDHLYVVQTGQVELAREGPNGHRVVARLGPGDFFGELALVPGPASKARAVAVSRARLLELDRETLEGMCMAQPEIAIRMIRILVARVVDAERRLALLGADDLLRPVVRAIQRLAEPASAGQTGFRAATTLRGLAEDTGLSMLETHRGLHQLFDRKLLHLLEDQLVVPDLEGLSACLEDGDDPASPTP